MSEIQKQALKLMAEDNTGAIFIPGGPNRGWVFPCHIRESEEVARKVVERLSK